MRTRRRAEAVWPVSAIREVPIVLLPFRDRLGSGARLNWSEWAMAAASMFTLSVSVPQNLGAGYHADAVSPPVDPVPLTTQSPQRPTPPLTVKGRRYRVAPPQASAHIYHIQWGDTLWSLSHKFDVSVTALERANHLSSSEIYAGHYLVIPETYTVKPGDTLAGIARRFRVPLVLLWHENRLASDKVKPGQLLVIPYLGTVPQAYRAPDPPAPDLALTNRGRLDPPPVTPNEVLMLAHLVQGEAGDQPFLGQVAVAAVVLNRLKAPGFPKTLSGVIWDPGQFESVSDGAYWQTPSATAMLAAKAALAGWDPTHGALYFYNPSLPHAAWMDSLPRTAVIGQQVFCR
jgi:N-acetylmuramoyl-L-alanine amidase